MALLYINLGITRIGVQAHTEQARRVLAMCRSAAVLSPVAAALAATLCCLVAPSALGAAPGFITKWGTFGTAPGQFNTPDGISVDAAGNVYVADRENNRIQKFTSDGALLAVWGRNGGDGSWGLRPGEFNGPYGVATDGHGDVYVLDSRNNRVQKLSSDGRFLLMWGRAGGGTGLFGTGPGEFADPRGIDVDRRGFVYVADHGNHRVQKFTADGRLLAIWGRDGGQGSPGAGAGEFNQPRGVTTDFAGDVYVAEKVNHRIQKLTADGRFITWWGKNGGAGGGDVAIGSAPGEFNLPYDVGVGARDEVYVTDTSNTRMQKFTSDGRFLDMWGSPGIGDGQFHDPYGVDTDCRGNVYVTDEENSRVQKFGDPRALPPRCPPRPVVTLPGSGGRLGGRIASFVECDLPCTVSLSGSIRPARGRRVKLRPTTRELAAAERMQLVLRLRSRDLRALRRRSVPSGTVLVRVRATATGFAGRSQPVSRSTRLFALQQPGSSRRPSYP